jgi:hypothetical protein
MPGVNEGAERARRDWGATVPQAGGDAIFDFLQICRHGVKFMLGVLPPTDPQAAPGTRLPAIYRRIQAASPPPDRADKRPWEFGILVHNGTENGQPFRSEDGDDSWKRRGVFFVQDIASLDQPEPGSIVLDRWLAVPARPITLPFTRDIDQRGFRSASYPQPETGNEGVTQVPVDYCAAYDLAWFKPLPPDSRWVAFSFDRFWPPERESIEYIAQVQEDCEHPPGDRDQAAATGSGSA